MKEKKLEVGEKQNSVEITRSVKGYYSWKIKEYYSDDWLGMLKEIGNIDAQIRKDYGGEEDGNNKG